MELIETAYGFNPWSALIDVELGQRPQVVGRAECYVGIWMIHPGAGRITAVSGIDEACRIPHVSKVHWRKKLGSLLSVREGTGQNPGWILAEGRTRDEVASALQLAAETINVDVDIEPEPS